METTEGCLWDAGRHMGRVKSLRNGSGAAATAARAGAAVWACRPAAGDESAAALEQQRAMAAIRAILSVCRSSFRQIHAATNCRAHASGRDATSLLRV